MMRVRYSIFIVVSAVFLFSCTKKPRVVDIVLPVSSVNWSLADSIDKAIHLPEIPDRDYNIIDFGATGNGKTDCTTAIQSALDKASSDGGGKIVVPAGVWLTGPIHLKNNTHLFLEEEAQIIFIPDPEKYPTVYTWYNGIPCMNYSPMIYARDAENIAITGKGVIDGQGKLNAWRKMKYKAGIDWNLLKKLENEKLKIEFRKFGAGYNLRPDLIGIYNCSNVLIKGISLRDAPFWGIHTVLSSNITLKELDLKGAGCFMSGITPESSQMVLIDQVTIEGVYEGVQVRAGRNKIKGNKSSENIYIRDVKVKEAKYNGIGVGIDINGGVQKVFVENAGINDCNRAYFIKTSPRRGGYVRNVFFKNCVAVNTYNQALYINVFHEANNGKDIPKIHDIYFENITADSCGRALYFEGSYKKCVENVYLENSNLSVYKSSYVEDVKNLNLNNVTINKVLVNGNYNIGKILDEKDNEEDEETLNTDNISLDELPDIVKLAAEKTIAGRELSDIDRKIMKTGVVYEVSYRTENLKEADIIIASDGRLLGYEVDIWHGDIPESIMNTIISALRFSPVEQQFTSIKIKHVEDFKFYEIEVETLNRIYKVEISVNGKILEKRERLIKSSFPPVNERI